jgi:hypothetical protein
MQGDRCFLPGFNHSVDMSPFSELDVVYSRVMTDYIAQFPSIQSSTTAGNKEVFHWELLDMRLQILESPTLLADLQVTPRKRTTTIDDQDGES